MGKVTIRVPEELDTPLFFPNGEISWELEDEKTLNTSRPFIYDVAYFAGVNSLTPWKNRDLSIPFLLQEWEMLKDPLKSHFSKRNKGEASSLMRLGTALFLEFFYWSNGQPVKLFPKIFYEDLPVKPVNIKERLDFIIARQNTYHSFMQLAELFKEMEKIYAKSKVVHKK